MNPQFKIHGQARRELKKKLSLIRRDLRAFDNCHSIHKDMVMVYGGEVMSDEEVMRSKRIKARAIAELETILAVPYDSDSTDQARGHYENI